MLASGHVWHRGNRGIAVSEPQAREDQVASAAIGAAQPCAPVAAKPLRRS